MTGMNAQTGQKLDGKAHIEQSIADILMTPVGTRIQRRDYGSLLPELLDQPLDDALLLQAHAATVIALRQWEPRISINQVRLSVGKQPGGAILSLDAVRLDSGSPQVDRLELNLRR